ncbi:MAG: hypothetical protein KTR33_09960 [Gammaproteobacteria bacterium]|nr:hypothetical protein [Gammaproteobacteria bacterium]
MSNLRWILLFAGFAILLLLYFSGRPRKDKRPAGESDELDSATAGRFDAEGLAEDLAPGADAGHRGSFQPQDAARQPLDHSGYDHPGYTAADPHARVPGADAGYAGQPYADPGLPASGAVSHDFGGQARDVLMDAPAAGNDGYTGTYPQQHMTGAAAGQADSDRFSPSDVFGAVDPDDLQRPGGPAPEARRARSAGGSEPFAASHTEDHVQSMGASIGEKIEAFSARLSPRRKSRVAASAPDESRQDTGDAGKIVSLHVVAPEGRMIAGQLLLSTFETRGYHHGDMNIFHSLHNGNTVFSIAKMVVPGTFDINNPESFATPGITLFLQLPGPVPGDVAFEVLISEAYELASALGCNILDSERSTLSRQTVQHLRESVYEYMHRQKYFNKAPSQVPG